MRLTWPKEQLETILDRVSLNQSDVRIPVGRDAKAQSLARALRYHLNTHRANLRSKISISVDGPDVVLFYMSLDFGSFDGGDNGPTELRDL